MQCAKARDPGLPASVKPHTGGANCLDTPVAPPAERAPCERGPDPLGSRRRPRHSMWLTRLGLTSGPSLEPASARRAHESIRGAALSLAAQCHPGMLFGPYFEQWFLQAITANKWAPEIGLHFGKRAEVDRGQSASHAHARSGNGGLLRRYFRWQQPDPDKHRYPRPHHLPRTWVAVHSEHVGVSPIGGRLVHRLAPASVTAIAERSENGKTAKRSCSPSVSD